MEFEAKQEQNKENSNARASFFPSSEVPRELVQKI